MAFADYFIRRPILAIVMSAIVLLAGVLALPALPLTEYPQVTPPTVVVRAAYPGADPAVVAETVAAPLEREITGTEDMLYMSSLAASDGRLTITVSFEQGVDPNRAQVDVQNRVARALPRLPREVQTQGVIVEKTTPDVLMVVHLVSPNGRYDALHLVNYADLNVRERLLRLPGVAQAGVWGAGEYSVRIWIDPVRLAALGLTADDVDRAIGEQNAEVAAGAVGEPPQSGAAFQVGVTVRGRLADVEAFEEIVVRTGSEGQLVRLRDVARVELGADTYALRSLLNNRDAAAIQIFQTPDASAIEVADRVRATMEELRGNFPEGIEYRIAYDPTIFVRESLRSVGTTLVAATVLVVIVIVAFLRTWRASLIPLAVVPVSIVGTFAAMHLLGFTLNTLSLFGLVLSIGIVVDDAIVVVENVKRHLADGLAPKDAAREAMREMASPIVATTLVLLAVFVPTAFVGGLSGMFYREFALTVAVATVISTFAALTLSPALAALLLKPDGAKPTVETNGRRRRLGRWGDLAARLPGYGSSFYEAAVARFVRARLIAATLYVGLGVVTYFAAVHVPTGFVPAQDKIYLVGIAQLPEGASLDRTEVVVRRMTDIALANPDVADVVAFPGLSVNGLMNVPNAAIVFAVLKPFEDRPSEGQSAGAIAGRLNAQFAQIGEGIAAMFPPPPVPGLGATGGFKLQIEDRANQGPEALGAAAGAVIAAAGERPELAGLYTGFRLDAPKLSLEVDREKAQAHGLRLSSVFAELQAQLGSVYVNDVTLFGRPYRVYVQADAPFREDESALGYLNARNAQGRLVPLASVITPSYVTGSNLVSRYNGFASADINGGAAPGVSSGQAVAAMEAVLRDSLPAGFAYEWTDLTYQQKASGNVGLWVFGLSFAFAYAILAAQYNSWTLPVAVLLVVPLSALGALAGAWWIGGDNNLFTQIGLLVLVGLASKNAILVVEFARSLEAEGLETTSAVIKASRLRLRPILMTSLSFVVGTIPLVYATGAGSEMQRAMGIAVFAGMLGVTALGLLLTPWLYLQVRSVAKAASGEATAAATNTDAATADLPAAPPQSGGGHGEHGG